MKPIDYQSAPQEHQPSKWPARASILAGLAGLVAAFETWRNYGPGKGGDWGFSRLVGGAWTAMFGMTGLVLGGMAKPNPLSCSWLKWLGITLGGLALVAACYLVSGA